MHSEPLRVLLVDDSPLFIAGVMSMLLQEGMLVVGATSSGADALQMAEGLEPDLVLMDAMMPGLNGFDTTRLMKRSANPPRVVIVTLCDSEIARQAAEDAEADGFLAKARFVEELPKLINQLFGDNRTRGK